MFNVKTTSIDTTQALLLHRMRRCLQEGEKIVISDGIPIVMKKNRWDRFVSWLLRSDISVVR